MVATTLTMPAMAAATATTAAAAATSNAGGNKMRQLHSWLF